MSGCGCDGRARGRGRGGQESRGRGGGGGGRTGTRTQYGRQEQGRKGRKGREEERKQARKQRKQRERSRKAPHTPHATLLTHATRLPFSPSLLSALRPVQPSAALTQSVCTLQSVQPSLPISLLLQYSIGSNQSIALRIPLLLFAPAPSLAPLAVIPDHHLAVRLDPLPIHHHLRLPTPFPTRLHPLSARERSPVAAERHIDRTAFLAAVHLANHGSQREDARQGLQAQCR